MHSKVFGTNLMWVHCLYGSKWVLIIHFGFGTYFTTCYICLAVWSITKVTIRNKPTWHGRKKRNRRGLSLRFLVVIRQHLSDLVRGSVVAQVVQDISEPQERFDANDLAAPTARTCPLILYTPIRILLGCWAITKRLFSFKLNMAFLTAKFTIKNAM